MVLKQVQALGSQISTSPQAVTQADFMIAKSMAKKDTKDHLVFYNSQKDCVEVFVQVFYSHEKWKLGVLKASIDKLQGKFVYGVSGVTDGRISDDAYYSLFAYCILSGQVLPDLVESKELRK